MTLPTSTFLLHDRSNGESDETRPKFMLHVIRVNEDFVYLSLADMAGNYVASRPVPLYTFIDYIDGVTA